MLPQIFVELQRLRSSVQVYNKHDECTARKLGGAEINHGHSAAFLRAHVHITVALLSQGYKNMEARLTDSSNSLNWHSGCARMLP